MRNREQTTNTIRVAVVQLLSQSLTDQSSSLSLSGSGSGSGSGSAWFSLSTMTEPSKVIHVRNVGPEISEFKCPTKGKPFLYIHMSMVFMDGSNLLRDSIL
ncbi:hypothetical protein CMV_029026 [Castanea mollissima]|uniref:Uncharacterized protein n=1 Tax=Castanea mollissima TaxID=60419 RepID=A0A8J4Q743_9ROSI|nr:hypothetical protein CMV_029026 [Castanea mollissima]